MPIPVQRGRFQPAAPDRLCTLVQEFFQRFVIGFTPGRRNHGLRKISPQCLGTRPAEQNLGLGVPACNESLRIHFNKGIRSLIQYGASSVPAVMQGWRFLSGVNRLCAGRICGSQSQAPVPGTENVPVSETGRRLAPERVSVTLLIVSSSSLALIGLET